MQASTGVGLDVTPEERLEILGSGAVDVTMTTLNPASMTFGAGTFHNPPWFVERLAELALERGIRPELEVYDFGHVGLCLDLVRRGMVREPLQFSFVMGVRGGMPGDPALLPQLRAMLPEGAIWQAIGIGRAQLPLSLAALAMGGNIRVGFEDNVYVRRGELAESNAQFVRRAVELIEAAGRDGGEPRLGSRAAGGPVTGGNDLLVRGALMGLGGMAQLDVLIEAGVITRVGAGLEAPQGAEVLDASGMVAFPGLINAHMHSGENFNPGLYENLPLDLWFVHSHQVTRTEPMSADAIYARTHARRGADAAQRHHELRGLPLRGPGDHAGDARAGGAGIPRRRHAGDDPARGGRQALRRVAAARRRAGRVPATRRRRPRWSASWTWPTPRWIAGTSPTG